MKAPQAPQARVAAYDWSGFYIGANAGYAWGSSNVATSVSSSGAYFVTTDPAQIAAAGQASLHPSGGTGGIQAGYNWQVGQLLYGLEVDFDAFGLNASRIVTTGYLTAPGTTFTVNQSVKTDWLFTSRGRLGWASNNWLLYMTGGLAITKIRYDNTFTDTFSPALENGSTSKAKTGWVLGGGLEYGLARNWSIKAEYLYMDFGSLSSSGAVSNTGAVPPAVLVHSTNLTAETARAGVNYRF